MERDLNKMYLAEGIRLSGSVLERATSTSSGTHGNYTAYYVKVLYEAPDGGIYVKNFKVTEDKESLENIQLIILPHYPASAIQYSTIDPLEKWMPDKWFTIDTDQFMKLFLSFVTVFGFNICVPWNMCVFVNYEAQLAVALIIACEVCISFVIGFFLNFSFNHKLGPGFLKSILLENNKFDATPYDESQEVQQPRPSMPRITYKEIFPHGTYTFCSILQSIVIDLLKFCVYGLVYFMLGIVLGLFLIVPLGRGLEYFIPIIDERTKRRISEQYIVNGTIVEGKVVHRFALGWKARVQYAVTDTSTSKFLRYEKTIPGAHLIAGRQVQVPDNPRLYILHPDLPCSARFADEIEMHDKIYECETSKWGRLAIYIIFLTLHLIFCVWLLCYQPVTGIAWSLSIISTCAIVLGVQLFMLWGCASLYAHLTLKDMVHDATQLFDVESDICAADNRLTLDDSTTTSEDSFDSESPSPCRRFFQGEVLYDKIRALD